MFAVKQVSSCLRPIKLMKYYVNQGSKVSYSSSNDVENQGNGKKPVKGKLLGPPEEPTTCCMSGCANCVWLEYAEELCKYYQDGGEKAIREINERITDPNVKAYVLQEIRMRSKK